MPDNTALYAGLDLGTSGCRACAVGPNGEPCGIGYADYADYASSESWWRAVRQSLAQLCESVDGSRIRAIAVCGTSGSVLITDSEGTPQGPALMYDDTRSQPLLQALSRHTDALTSCNGLASAMWLLEHHANRHTHHILTQADWITGRLTGVYGQSDTNNCLKLGFDPIQDKWPDWVLSELTNSNLLPRVRSPGSPVGIIDGECAKILGLAKDTQVLCGTTDSVGGFIATGANRKAQAVTSLGSTLVLKIISDKPVFDRASGIYSHRLGNLWLAGGASNSGGKVLRAFFTQGQMDTMTPRLDTGQSTGLDYYPLLRPGERFPVFDPQLAPRLTPRPVHDLTYFQGMLEAMAAIEKRGYALLQQHGAPYPNEVISVGGGARNAAWAKIRERELGVPVRIANNIQAACGAAMLALADIPGLLPTRTWQRENLS